MVKGSVIIVLILCLTTVLSGCSVPDPVENSDTPPAQAPVKEISQGSENDQVDIDDSIPGTNTEESVINGIADWADYADGISIADTPINIDKWFETEQVKEIVNEYKSITLEDGSIIGYVIAKFRWAGMENNVIIDGNEEYDYMVGIITEIAASLALETYTELWDTSMLFIISRPEKIDKLIEYKTFFMQGFTADVAKMQNFLPTC